MESHEDGNNTAVEVVPALMTAGSGVAENAAASEEPAAKREASAKRKKGAAGTAAPSATAAEASKQQLSGHSQAVSSVVWPAPDTIVSGGWDNTVGGHFPFGHPQLAPRQGAIACLNCKKYMQSL